MRCSIPAHWSPPRLYPPAPRRRLSAWDDIYCWGQRGVPLQCCSWCPGDSNYVATVAQDSPSVVVLDVRRAGRVGASVLADLALPQARFISFHLSQSEYHDAAVQASNARGRRS